MFFFISAVWISSTGEKKQEIFFNLFKLMPDKNTALNRFSVKQIIVYELFTAKIHFWSHLRIQNHLIHRILFCFFSPSGSLRMKSTFFDGTREERWRLKQTMGTTAGFPFELKVSKHLGTVNPALPRQERRSLSELNNITVHIATKMRGATFAEPQKSGSVLNS